ncbi:hypothetical protein [Lactiplantibacillus modestisalitolerans]|uniref:Uncharacterized protein n=1 Tax=Lactiplantibacillus modestisalitolerans TaxID=1457219 RepID=A0ABV5WVY6_9LACO|nr:hypothetical protein [Lactiplantibacillus modestisalitolerans]
MAKIMAVAVGALIGGTSRALINGWLAGPHHFITEPNSHISVAKAKTRYFSAEMKPNEK